MKGRIASISVSLVGILASYCLATDPNITIRNSHAADSQYVYIFAHGLGAYQKQALDLYARYKDFLVSPNYWVLNEPLAIFDFPDAKTKENEYHAKLVNLAQKADMERLEHIYNEVVRQFPGKKIILVGLSRGASVIINLMATKKLDNVAAIILESPFDTLKSIVIHLLNRYHIHWLPYARNLGFKIAKKHFPSLDINGIFPMQIISKMPAVPILFVHSRKDKVIPINSSRKLYVKLALAGHKDIYLLELKNGLHGKILASPEGELYQNAVHAFYKKYDLPHDPQLAILGESLLVQPTVPDVMARITSTARMTDIDDEAACDQLDE